MENTYAEELVLIINVAKYLLLVQAPLTVVFCYCRHTLHGISIASMHNNLYIICCSSHYSPLHSCNSQGELSVHHPDS